MDERSISLLLEDIQLKRIVLPEIQREYVWSAQKAKDLIDSLYQNFPVGIILLWRPRDAQSYKLMEGQESVNKEPDWYVLDGQQRLTSLTKIIRGEIKIRYHIDNKIFRIENRAISSDPKWIRIDEVIGLGTTQTLNKLSQKLDIPSNKIFEEYYEGIQKIENIKKEKIPILEIRDDDYERITKIYVRLNEKGTKLKKAEINLALLILQFPKTFYKDLTCLIEQFDEWELDSNFFLKCFVCISTNQSKFEMLRKYLPNATSKKVSSDLKKIAENVDESLRFLSSHFGINENNNTRLIPSNTVLIALVMYNIKTNGRMSDRDLKLLKLWFFAASHYSRYSGSSETILNKDLRSLNNSDPLKKWLKDIVSERNDLNMHQFDGRINRTNLFALNWALILNNAVDWWSGSTISEASNIEFHHIFPKKILREEKYPDVLINDIRNIAIVSKKANRRINAKSPIKYFKDDIEDMNRISSQLVPEDEQLWKVENYRDFLNKRGELIIHKLNHIIDVYYSEI